MLRSLFSSAQALRSVYIGFFQLPWLPEAVLRRHLAGLLVASGLPVEVADEYQRFLSAPRALRSALHWYRGMWLPDRRQSRVSPAESGVRATYLWGNGDPALGRRAAELTRRYAVAGYRFVELEEGHWLPERASARVAEEILSDL
jgi:hypothetical protein